MLAYLRVLEAIARSRSLNDRRLDNSVFLDFMFDKIATIVNKVRMKGHAHHPLIGTGVNLGTKL